MPDQERNFRDGVMTVEDGSDSSPKSLLIALSKGNTKWDEKKNYVQSKDRGRLGSLRPGDEEPCPVSFGANHANLVSKDGGTTPTLREVLYGEGAAADWVSTSEGVYTVRIKLLIYKPPDTDQKDELIVFEKFALQSFPVAEGDPNSMDISGLDWETKPTITAVEEES